MWMKFVGRSQVERAGTAPIPPKLTVEEYSAEVASLASDMLRPQSFIDPLYADVPKMAEALGVAPELENAIHSAFEAGKSAEEMSLSVMLKGLDYRAQIEAALGHDRRREVRQ